MIRKLLIKQYRTQHIPYRNNPLTKLLKSSLGGNNKAAIIMCIAPTKLQFNHSVQTFKFGLNAKRIKNNVKKNVMNENTEETLKLLIQEYQERLGCMKTECSQSEYEELKEENRILREQFKKTEGLPLFKFTLNDKEEVDFSFENGMKGKQFNEMEIVKKCIEALKVKCKESYMWQKEVQRLKELNKKLNTSIETIEEAEDYITTCKNIIQDYVKLIKAQAIKLDIYESIDKYISLLSAEELEELINSLKMVIERCEKARSGSIKIIPRNILYALIAKASTTSKIHMSSKYNEAYVTSFLLKNFTGSEVSSRAISISSSSDKTDIEYDKEILKYLGEIQRLIKDTSIKTSNNSYKDLSPSKDIGKPNDTLSSGANSRCSPKKSSNVPQRENMLEAQCRSPVRGPVLKRDYKKKGIDLTMRETGVKLAEDSFNDTEMLLTKNVLEMSKPLNPERKAELKELQKLVNQMYMK